MKLSTKKTKPTAPKKTAVKLKDYVSWFEIPAINIERSANFYNVLYDIKMEITGVNDYAMAFFPAEKGIGGAIVSGEGCIPSDKGSLIYLNAGKDLDLILPKIAPAGGRVILPKTKISNDAGYFALFIDTEGNKMALHSNS